MGTKLTDQQIIDIYNSANAKPALNALERTWLTTLKLPPSTLAQINKLISVAKDVASLVGTVGTAISAVQSLLELIGALEKDDPFKDLKDFITAKFEELKDFHQDEEYEEQMERRTRWAIFINNARAALLNLNASRSQSNFLTAVEKLNGLSDALEEMLATGTLGELEGLPLAGAVTLDWKAYGFPGEYSDPASHWMAYAGGGLMQTRGMMVMGQIVGARSVAYNQQSDNLKQRIWDPSYYLDLLASGTLQYVALLTAIEPAFRATGYARADLLNLATQLQKFVDTWRQSLIVTIPEKFFSRAGGNESYIWHPFANPYLPERTNGIPVGVADAVSGLAIFDPVWSAGIQAAASRPFVSTENRVVNTSEAIAAAQKIIDDAAANLEKVCGIESLQQLADKVRTLCDYGLYGSQFVTPQRIPRPVPTSRFGEFEFSHSWPLLGEQEELSLGAIGVKAGKPGKLYSARRVYDDSSRHFRIPIVRRMDASRIQLGYRFTVSVEKEGLAPRECVLAKYESISSPDTDAASVRFPASPPAFELIAGGVRVYDVVQASLLSEDRELAADAGANDGIPRRLFLNPRPGNIGVRCMLALELKQDETHPFIGHANVTVTVTDPGLRDAFLLHIRVFETARVAWGSYLPELAVHDQVREIAAGSMVLPVIPSYLLAEEEFFEDRVRGLAVFDKSIAAIKPLIPFVFEQPRPDPKWHYRNQLEHDEALVSRFEALARAYPSLAGHSLARLQAPALEFLQPRSSSRK